MSQKTKGVLIIAAGSPYYGRMAFNLAISIRANEPDMSIGVITGGNGLKHLTDDQKSAAFDHIIDSEDAETLGAGAKLLAYDLTPFDRTLIVDADNLFFPGRTPSEIIDPLDGVSFTAITEGVHDIESGETDFNPAYPFWADLAETLKAYKIKRGKVHQWRSEVMYFEKGKKAETLFHKALAIFRAPKITPVEWAGGVPDEFAINVAAALTETEPHVYRWEPTFWAMKQRTPMPQHEIAKRFPILSTGGNQASPTIKKIYNNIAAHAHRIRGMQFLFLLQSKSLALPERKKY